MYTGNEPKGHQEVMLMAPVECTYVQVSRLICCLCCFVSIVGVAVSVAVIVSSFVFPRFCFSFDFSFCSFSSSRDEYRVKRMCCVSANGGPVSPCSCF